MKLNSGFLTRMLGRIAITAALAGVVAGCGFAAAQAPAPTAPAVAAPAPMIRIMAIGRFVSPPSPDQLRTLLPTEVKETVKLYLAGKIDQWYAMSDQSGVIFLLNVPTAADAHALLDPLPLGRAKLMEFQLITVGPLSPLAALVGGCPSSLHPGSC